ncbi:pilus assembly protein PilP [Pseudomonadota bacterium]
MSRIFIICFGLLICSPIASAQNPISPIANGAILDEAESEAIPDAMQQIVKAPPVDFANLRDPFSSYLTLVAQRGQAILNEQRQRFENRERELLESFDLSTLKLVGVYSMGEDRVAMVEDATGEGHTVRRGNYMGKNNGQIEKIEIDTVYLVEQIINPAGDVVDNQVTLTLKEVNK